MKNIDSNRIFITFLISVICVTFSKAQSGSLQVKQDHKIDQLLELKKEMNTSDEYSERYRIQIFSGNRDGANKAQQTFEQKFENWSTKMVYETPNYKMWAGSFRTRLEADRALVLIKKEFPAAFIFKPKKKR